MVQARVEIIGRLILRSCNFYLNRWLVQLLGTVLLWLIVVDLLVPNIHAVVFLENKATTAPWTVIAHMLRWGDLWLFCWWCLCFYVKLYWSLFWSPWLLMTLILSFHKSFLLFVESWRNWTSLCLRRLFLLGLLLCASQYHLLLLLGVLEEDPDWCIDIDERAASCRSLQTELSRAQSHTIQTTLLKHY